MQKTKIGVDYRLANKHLGGMAVYLKSIFNELVKKNSNEYLLFDDNPTARPGFKKNIWTVIWEQVWVQVCLTYLFWKNGVTTAYFPNPPVSFFLWIPLIVTVPDVSFYYDEGMSRMTKQYLMIMYFMSVHKAKIITTFSQNSKKDIVNLFHVNPEKVFVTPLAASESIGRIPLTKKKHIICVPGTMIPRKNIKEAIEAFHRLPKGLRKNIELIIVGHTSKRIEGDVCFTGRISDNELSKLYSESHLFMCTSLYEGFGLPILEAMRCGVPVVSYKNSSLPEAVGDAGVLVSNVSELVGAMERVLTDSKFRKTLIKSGYGHEKRFSWGRTASIFLKVIESC